MFELNDVSFHLAGRRLLQQISLQLPQGQTVGLIGHNGSGKSTLVKLLARQLEPTGGRLRLDGRPLNEWPEREFARHVAYLPQRLPAVENLTVRELVGFGRYPWHGPLGRFGADDRLHVERALELTGAAGFAERPAERLSDGERQRVWLAMLLAQNTRYLLLDEPSSAPDPAHQVEILDLLRDLGRHLGLGVVMVLHDINMAARYCDRLVALHGGRLLASGPPSALMNPATLEALYSIPMHVLQHPEAGQPVAVVH
ncbi:iron(III)-siderophore ABC transporter ATP-binding protein [Azotobacter vinelandii CA]|uniref:Iron(III)-siderophore ABC transporter ATP-binding protein n=1 Tax=Azotobacter vinelandii (strain DJ / ATCC BAA-1303) TaxID=322710 RepID=C1DLC9_AZOVD|nr:ATP-binding cassette domain-containing protein [Azotobacter vinelandii]ACO81122.1 iron(III)-siderophore ABC transporter ATP-binding protein [Azotobacter vinelandii DJ]AGK13458.1 iron(III)-siderophore ABC transporter ATP-binding protein [Azotobacter vinelandii CA]WKN21869.1 ATP-binding cassette domain-containing protein [Azotobacter vinelandii]SFX92912.1 iron complex transport system ATP-binding protein [Azotobacter vinelandii]GLK61069.1 iron-hydroxamate transporter ATP-binding protein [Azot